MCRKTSESRNDSRLGGPNRMLSTFYLSVFLSFSLSLYFSLSLSISLSLSLFLSDCLSFYSATFSFSKRNIDFLLGYLFFWFEWMVTHTLSHQFFVSTPSNFATHTHTHTHTHTTLSLSHTRNIYIYIYTHEVGQKRLKGEEFRSWHHICYSYIW